MTPLPLQAVLLAAGRGSRFGGETSKLLAGSPPLVLRALARLQAGLRSGLQSDDTVLAVVRPGQDRLAALLAAHGAQVTVCPRADDGMGASLAHAAACVPDGSAVIVALGDMPCIAPATIAAVCHALRQGASLVQPHWQGRPGHPVGFAACWLPALRALAGDEGARHLLREYAAQRQQVAVDDPGCVFDVDRPADLDQLPSPDGTGR